MAIGKNIRYHRERLNKTLEYVSERSGVDIGTISALENRDSSRSKFFPAIAKGLGMTFDELVMEPEEWLTYKNTNSAGELKAAEPIKRSGPAEMVEIGEDPDYITIRRVEFKLTGGITGFKVEYLNGERQPIVFRKSWFDSRGFDPNKLYAISVKGHSMAPKINEDDVVVVNTGDITPVDTKLFAINYEGELLVKRLVRDAGQWYLSSDNPDKVKYPNKICHADCFIIGRIVSLHTENL